MTKIYALIAILVSTHIGFSQTDQEALRYSMLEYTGSARFMGSGGAFGALGSEFGAISTNPASMGRYKRNELVISPAFYIPFTKTSYLGQADKASKTNFHFSNIGIVFNNTKETNPGLVGLSLAVGYNRLGNYHKKFSISGFNPSNSMIDSYVEEANTLGVPEEEIYNVSPFGAGLAYDAYLIDPDPLDSLRYIGKVPNGGVTQSLSLASKGAYDEIVIGGAANYRNRFHIGAIVGLPSIRYEEEKIYVESDNLGNIQDFNQFTKTETLKTRGRGINGKLGVLVEISEELRIAGSVHTPVSLKMNDTYSTNIVTDLNTIGVFQSSSPEGTFEYRLVTPWRFNGSIGMIIKPLGFISVEYERG